MRLKWYGHAAFRLMADTGLTVITDPYGPACVGYPPITDAANVVIISSDDDEGHCRADLIAGKPQVINALTVAREGRPTTVAGLTVQAIEVAEWEFHAQHAVPGANGMYRFEIDGISIGHMGDAGNALDDRQLEFFAGLDVLLALAGGPPTIALPDLQKLIDEVQPRMVIPMHFRTLTYRPADILWIESFLQCCDEQRVDFACASEIEIRPDTLPQEHRVMVLDYARQE